MTSSMTCSRSPGTQVSLYTNEAFRVSLGTVKDIWGEDAVAALLVARAAWPSVGDDLVLHPFQVLEVESVIARWRVLRILARRTHDLGSDGDQLFV